MPPRAPPPLKETLLLITQYMSTVYMCIGIAMVYPIYKVFHHFHFQFSVNVNMKKLKNGII